MKMSSIVKTVAAVAAVGTAAFLYSNSSPRTKRRLKKTAGQYIHSMGEMMNSVSDMI